ncbi:MAG: PEP-CTERM sorting domain-containing protein [Planctomycetia bacterium]|nr:MAG: PEP-CTERM sorting domain-containing protein [Planctomycetia bacterium]
MAIGAAALCALFGPAAVPGSWQQLPGPAAAMGQVMVFNQPRHPVGGPGADTSFIDDGGNSIWQQVADDIILGQDATIGRIKWFGFYGGTFTGSTQPPTTQTMRIRFYDSRPGDGLPGVILFEESIVDPLRIPTGAVIPLPLAPIEQRFEVDLMTPFDMLAGVQYWMEIVQLADINSHYRWEYSLGNQTPYAFLNPNVNDWRRTSTGANVAFELWTVPEPSSVLLVLGALALTLTRLKTRR